MIKKVKCKDYFCFNFDFLLDVIGVNSIPIYLVSTAECL